MFQNKRGDQIDPSSGMPHSGQMTVIAQGVRVEGDFVSQGDVAIEGDVNGSVSVGGKLSLGAQSNLQASVKADQASVAGSIKGNVTVNTHLDIKATAKIHGDVSCATVAVESGAVVHGTVSIGGEQPPAQINKRLVRTTEATVT